MSRRVRISLAVLSGLMLGASFPPSPFYSLAYVAFVPLLLLFERVDTYKQVLWYTYLMSVVFHAVSVYWVGGFTHARDPYLMTSGAALVFLHPALYWIVTVPYYFLRRNTGAVAGLAAFPFLWLSYDYLHSLTDFSFPWMSVGNSQAYDLSRIQLAEYTSMYGPEFLVLLFNVLAFVLLIQLASRSWSLRSRYSLATVGVMVLVYFLPYFYGRSVMKNRELMAGGTHLRVGVVQPNIDPWEKWGQPRSAKWQSYQEQVRLLVDESKVLASDGAALIVWPETAVPFEVRSPHYAEIWSMLRRDLDSIRVPVFTGLPWMEYFDSTHAPVTAIRIPNTNTFVDAYNSAALLLPGQPVGPIYKKMVLVPFAERVPFAEKLSFLIGALKWSVGISGWGKGEEQLVYHLPQQSGSDVPLSGMICYESVYPDFVRTFVSRGAQLLLVITNDSWWGNTSGAYQHASFASFRAIENRRWVVQSANGGISVLVDPIGIVHASTKMYTRTRLIGEVVPSTEMTFYTKHGDWFAQLCLFCSALFLIITSVKTFRSRRS